MNRHDVPSWIQAGAAILSLIVTGVLARLTAKYVRLTEQIARASEQQVNQAIRLAKTNQISVARALLEESERIRSELGDAPDDALPLMIGGGALVPTVHAWMHPIIPAVAQLDAAIVGLFLKLDRDLHNYDVASRQLRVCEIKATEARETAERVDRICERRDENLAIDLEAELSDQFAAKHAVDVTKHNEKHALQIARITYRGAHRTLDEIQERLGTIVAA